MMAGINNLSNEIAAALATFTNEISKELEQTKKKVVRDAVKDLKATSPKDQGDYARGWKATRQGDAMVIHNANKPQLTHLLEGGHAKQGGGRVAGKSHIEPVEQRVIKEFERELERVIQK